MKDNQIELRNPWAPVSGGVGRRVKMLFLTSFRDIGTCDRNGVVVKTRNGSRYMEGIIEHCIRQTYPGGILSDFVEVVGIVYDDLPRDMKDSDFPLFPTPGMPWIHPLDLVDPYGRYLIDMTYNIPSDFRLLPSAAKNERFESKCVFEQKVKQLMINLGADVLISDHYMAVIEWLIGQEGQMYGKLLNIHPAIIVKDHPFCFRGKTPTADSIAAAQTRPVFTGATLHVVNEEVDGGPPIAYYAGTPVYASDKAQWLRYRNYQGAKLPVFVTGLLHYVRCLYPAIADMAFCPQPRQVVAV